MTERSKASVWWGGAISSAIKGIPQGLMLGLLGFGLLVGTIYLLAAIPATAAIGLGLGKAFGTFIFAEAIPAAATALPALSLSTINILPVVALNAVLTVVGNFLTGGDMAVAKHQQEVDHAKNEVRINAIEGREKKIEQVLSQHLSEHKREAVTPRHVQQILEQGPRVRVETQEAIPPAATHAEQHAKHASHAAEVVADRLESAERTIH